jgi:hypothetical protein
MFTGSAYIGCDSIGIEIRNVVRRAKNMPFRKIAILQYQIVSMKLKSVAPANPAETENSGQTRESSDKIVMICANATELGRQVRPRNF